MTGDAILIQFPTRHALTLALDHLMAVDSLTIERAAVLVRRDDRPTVLEGQIGASETGVVGALLGVVLVLVGSVAAGAFTLPGLWPIAALIAAALLGAAVGFGVGWLAGGLIARMRRSPELVALADGLDPGHPALVLYVPDAKAALPTVRAELVPYRAEYVERVRLDN